MAEYQEYLDFLYSALATQNKKSLVLTEDISLVADIGLSSLEVMEFIEKIEDHFDISIPLNILPDVNTIGDLAKKGQGAQPLTAILPQTRGSKAHALRQIPVHGKFSGRSR